MTNQFKTILLLGALTAVLVGFGGLLSPRMFYLMTALAAVVNLGAYFFSDRIVLKLHRAREVDASEAPGLHAMVEEVAARAGIPKPRVYLMDTDHANAFATGRNPSKGVVAVTQGLLRLMTPREVKGVIAHEIAHIKNRDILVASIAAAVAAAVAHLANVVQWGAIFGGVSRDEGEDGGSPLAALALALVAPVAATLIQLGISRSREYLADETAARLTGDPVGLANGLKRLSAAAALVPGETAEPATASLFIVNPFSGGGALLNWFSTHPPAEARIARLLAMAGLVRAA
ncbi:MAG: M48 family metalloprotease [Bacteroidales bacterium]